MTSKSRTITILLTAVLVLSLLLTACSNGGDTPTGDNSTPGVTDTQTPDNTPGATDTSPDNTTDATDPSTPGASETPTDEKQYGMPTWADPSNYDMEKVAGMDESIEYYGELYGVDIDKLIDEVIAEYGQYIDVHITPEAVRTAIAAGIQARREQRKDGRSLSSLPENSIKKANAFLAEKGLTPFEYELGHGDLPTFNNSKDDIACLAVAASLFYEVNLDGYNDPDYDLLGAFSYAYAGFSYVNSGTGKDYEAFPIIFKIIYYVKAE